MSAKIKPTGGFAFPACGTPGLDPCGMTLRDYFAAATLPALIRLHFEQSEKYNEAMGFHNDIPCDDYPDGPVEHDTIYLCEEAYDIADQMLVERAKKVGDRL